MSPFLPSEHYATVALNFQNMVAETELQLECKGVPVSNEEEHIIAIIFALS